MAHKGLPKAGGIIPPAAHPVHADVLSSKLWLSRSVVSLCHPVDGSTGGFPVMSINVETSVTNCNV